MLRITKEELTELYYNQRRSTSEIGHLVNRSPLTIYLWLKKYGLATNKSYIMKGKRVSPHSGFKKGSTPWNTGKSKYNLSKELLRELYVEKHLYGYQIARLIGASKSCVLFWLAKFGIPRRHQVEELNKNPELIKKRLAALCKKPTKPERQLMKIIQEYRLPYKYVGDGSLIIEGLNPDFININGKKNIIEVFGRVWHETLLKDKDWKRSELGRIMIFNSYGFKTLIIWENELKDEEKVVRKIKRFTGIL